MEKIISLTEKYFALKKNNTTIKIEFIAGITTFMTMSYIIFVNPIILSNAMGTKNSIAIMAATCISSAIATFLMGILANYPIALAPGMGMNALFTFTLCNEMKISWEIALGIIFISSLLFTILCCIKIRQYILDAIPRSLKIAIAVGIGFFIAFIGLKEGGFIAKNDDTFVTLGRLNIGTIVAIVGIIITVTLMIYRIMGAILIGIIGTGLIALCLGVTSYHGCFQIPHIEPIFNKVQIFNAFKWQYLSPIIMFLFLSMFDSMGTLLGVCQMGGLIDENGSMKRPTHALLSDSISGMIGAICGTSTVTCYIESSAGVSIGGKTGLTNIFTGIFFILALFFTPLVKMIGNGYDTGIKEIGIIHPITSPALILVGFLMMSCIKEINWEEYLEAIPSFFIILFMTSTFSIAHGVAAGFITYCILAIITGNAKKVSKTFYLITLIIILGYFLM